MKKITDWTEQEDLELVSIVLQHVRTNQTMTSAFKAAEEKLGRSAGGCKFRWTTALAKKYDGSVEQARLQSSLHPTDVEEKLKMTPEITLPKNRPVVDPPVTKGIQQEINFENDEITDSKPEPVVENPFTQINNLVSKLERKYKDSFLNNEQLKKDMNFLNHELDAKKKELELADEEVKRLSDELAKANKRIELYAEIEDLVAQFNTVNK